MHAYLCYNGIICNGCNENYIGESGDSLRHRAAVHRNHILLKHNRNLVVSNRIYHCAKEKLLMFKICPFYTLQCEEEVFQKEKRTILYNNISHT